MIFRFYPPFLACLKIEKNITDEHLLEQVGERLAALRLGQNLTQAQLAEKAGLGLRTVQRLEAGAAATHLSGFLRACRVLGVLDRLDLLLPEPGPSPIEQLKLHGKRRQRASGRKAKQDAGAPWSWGEPS